MLDDVLAKPIEEEPIPRAHSSHLRVVFQFSTGLFKTMNKKNGIVQISTGLKTKGPTKQQFHLEADETQVGIDFPLSA